MQSGMLRLVACWFYLVVVVVVDVVGGDGGNDGGGGDYSVLRFLDEINAVVVCLSVLHSFSTFLERATILNLEGALFFSLFC